MSTSCRAAGISTSSFYYKPKPNDDDEVKHQIELVIEKRPRRGFPTIFDAIRRSGYKWNHKKVYRVYKKHEFQLKGRKKQRIKPLSPKVMPISSRLNEVWSIDFMSDGLNNGRKFRTFNVIDDFNRESLMIEVAPSFPSLHVIRILGAIGSERGYPRYIRSDNGPEFISREFRKFCCQHRIRHRRIEPRKPQQNSYIERFNRSYREDILDLYAFDNLEQARTLTIDWQNEYNYDRGHSSLGGKSPMEYASSFFPLTPQPFNEGIKGKKLLMNETLHL